MGTLALTLPTIGQPNSTEDVKIPNALSTIQTDYNGNVDENNLKPALLDKLGVSSGTIRRGKMTQTAAESTGALSYSATNLTTPDRVQNIVLPTDGILCVGYRATWQESVNNAASAGVFIGANQLKISVSAGGAPVAQQAIISTGSANIDRILSSTDGGLVGNSTAGIADGGDVTTGMPIALVQNGLGGIISIFAAGGTYDVSVQFKVTSGTVTVKNRHLWVWTMGF